jgi:hypothetical protein
MDSVPSPYDLEEIEAPDIVHDNAVSIREMINADKEKWMKDCRDRKKRTG